jgi:beta-1,2-mannobiose phosphorylase / 1,2-beta-oligomannan phosphorylase
MVEVRKKIKKNKKVESVVVKASAKKLLVKKVPVKKVVVSKKVESKVSKKSVNSLKVVKHESNPIITPSKNKNWQDYAVFNPAAILLENKIYLMYRAQGSNGNCSLGYVQSDDGVNFDEDQHLNFYQHLIHVKRKSKKKIKYESGGNGMAGCEDPRLVNIGDEVILTYTAMNGWDSVRMALSKISKPDFINRLDNWTSPMYISPPRETQKNWVLFPEKINGKFAILHAINPKIMIDYFDDFDHFSDDNYIYSIHDRSPIWSHRDKNIRGCGPPPIKTVDGWLVLYHAHKKNDSYKYHINGMLLDLNDPSKVLYNCKDAIISPEEHYELSGLKSGIVYTCGAVILDDIINIYYGSSDNYICLAKVKLSELLKKIKDDSSPIVIKQKKLPAKKYVYS